MRRELRALLRLAWPVVVGQVGAMMLSMVDAFMVGRLGALELAAVGVADATVMWGSLVFAYGLVLGVDPLITQAHGARDGATVGLTVQRGVVMSLVATIPVMVAWLNAETLLTWFGTPAELIPIAHEYASVQAWSVAPWLLFMVMRQYLLGREMMWAPLWIILFANVANVGLNELLIFGRLGFPELGVRGAAYASSLTRLLMAVAMFVYIVARGLQRGAWTPWTRRALRIGQVARIGLPIAIQIGLETWCFLLCMVWANRIGTTAVAAHFISIRIVAFLFMVPLGISVAATTRVGNLLGAGERDRAQTAAWAAYVLGTVAMLFSGTLFILVPEALASIFTDERAVLALCTAVLPIAAAFQLFDGAQVVGCGILRGMGTTRPAAVINVLGYYALALPIGYALAFRAGMELRGLWWGLCIGLGAVSIALVAWTTFRGPRCVGALRNQRPATSDLPTSP